MSLSSRLLTLALLAPAACGKAPAEAPSGQAVMDLRHTRPPGGRAVARWSGDSVTAEELTRRFQEMSPALRERYVDLGSRRDYVESLARFDLLVREALAQGLQDDAEVVEATRRALVARLMRSRLEEARVAITDAELAEAYAARRDDFVRPEMVRLSHVFLAAPRGDDAAEAAARSQAQAVLAQARALHASDFAAFGQLAREHSQEPRTAPLDGDLRFLPLDALSHEFGPEVAQAARALTDEGALSDVVRTEKGLHVLKLRARQPARHLSLDDVREELRVRLESEKRTRAWADYLANVEKRLSLSVDMDALGKVPVDVQAPMRAHTGVMPGTVPAP
ncbi:PpiC-type peptidyl-prolyl cis-trans isomerase [Myxococcus stipitatus DSM 14675]|uniref:PpiC-type peptidyl-prolyl cis-trans isomerase n=1 Tax=Myxococcus stipitatus (strain DSM 14675 / JCM 12634 / Mx s8) TaxID=1278073 RepID=L7U1Y3_MYXSD|nr:peptidylprolyl isomerase [Myxococcus stipitatus]AGC41840.1 PpiC-type peptidyl-prolyl cis-trans isomerase [Myxococcus stipitatus DSM 14675]